MEKKRNKNYTHNSSGSEMDPLTYYVLHKDDMRANLGEQKPKIDYLTYYFEHKDEFDAMLEKHRSEESAIVRSIPDTSIYNWIRSASNNFQNDDKTITLRRFIKSFRTTYMSFKNEYAALDKIKLGKIDFLDFYTTESNGQKVRTLTFKLRQRTNDSDLNFPCGENYRATISQIGEDKARLFTYTVDRKGRVDDKYREHNGYSQEQLTGYLDLFEKYQRMFEFYNMLGEDTRVCKKGKDALDIDVLPVDGNILHGLRGIKVNIKQLTFYIDVCTDYELQIHVYLGKGMHIDVEQSDVRILGDSTKQYGNRIYDSALDTVRFSRSHLADYDLDIDKPNQKAKKMTGRN